MLDNLVCLYYIYTCTYVAKDPYGKKQRKKLKNEKKDSCKGMYLFNLAISIWNLFCDCSTKKGKSNKKKQNILNYGSGAEEDDGDYNGFEIDDYDASNEHSGIDLLYIHFTCITFLVSVMSNKYACIFH